MKKRLFLTAAVLAAAVLCSCRAEPEEKEEDFPYIFCLNEDRSGLAKVKYAIVENEPEKAAYGVIAKLREIPEKIKYTPAIPKGVAIYNVELEGQILKIDFAKEYLDIPAMEEKLTRAALVKSLTQIKGVNAVLITVDGEDLLDSTGEKAGILTADDFVKSTGASMSSYITGTVLLYFSNEARDALIPVEEKVTYNSNTAMEKVIMEKLAKGPKKGWAYPTLDPNVTIFGVTIKDRICYVNLDEAFLAGQVDVKPEVTVYSIVNSLIEGTNASKVQITINGKKDVVYRDAVDFTNPLQRDMEWVEKKE